MFHSWFTYESDRLALFDWSSTLHRLQRSFISRIFSSVLVSFGLYRTTVTFSVIQSPSSLPIWYGFSFPPIARICSKRSAQYFRADSKCFAFPSAALFAALLAYDTIDGPPSMPA